MRSCTKIGAKKDEIAPHRESWIAPRDERPPNPAFQGGLKKMRKQVGAARGASLLAQLEQQPRSVANPAANKTSAMAGNRPPPSVTKKESLGAWRQSMEKKLNGIKEQELALRLAALNNQSKPGDAAKLVALRGDYSKQMLLVNKAVEIGLEKIERYKKQQASGEVLSPAQKKELADTEVAVLELRQARLL
jgi:hypothetical protein